MKIYLIRHGETDWNNKGIIQGRTDNSLNETGRNQAKDVANFFTNINPDALISSSLKRAYETLEIIKKENNFNLLHQVNDNFIERDFGYFDGKQIDEYYATTDFKDIKGFEQTTAVSKRVVDGINELYQAHKDDVLIIVAHSHTIKSLLFSLDPKKYEFNNFHLKNCAIVELDVIDTNISVIDIH